MALRRDKFKAYDMRTGRLERATQIIQDGDEPSLWVSRSEADPAHPLRRKIRIPPDRGNLFPGRTKQNTYEDAKFKYVYGYTSGPNLVSRNTQKTISFSGTHDFSADTFKMALFKDAAALSDDTTVYATDNEIENGNGYTTGGATMTLSSGYPTTEGGLQAARFENLSWTFTANKQVAYALMYNTSQSDAAVLVLQFPTGRQFIGSFQITFPASHPALIIGPA
jgi:hypothetical protein